MGNKSSSLSSKPKDYIDPSLPIDVYQLKKRRPGCTGMFWRSDPMRKSRLENNNHWPRDGAALRGQVITANGKQWLAATEVKQSNGEWTVSPYGSYIPFEHDNHYYLEKTEKYTHN
mmetsp:Transcript_18588/g.26708  ORF Transcript_18588/g.26708 Transcript_18588/m.26708 type:complete len:116 (+) Transcript_18588:217-564(+)